MKEIPWQFSAKRELQFSSVTHLRKMFISYILVPLRSCIQDCSSGALQSMQWQRHLGRCNTIRYLRSFGRKCTMLSLKTHFSRPCTTIYADSFPMFTADIVCRAGVLTFWLQPVRGMFKTFLVYTQVLQTFRLQLQIVLTSRFSYIGGNLDFSVTREISSSLPIFESKSIQNCWDRNTSVRLQLGLTTPFMICHFVFSNHTVAC